MQPQAPCPVALTVLSLAVMGADSFTVAALVEFFARRHGGQCLGEPREGRTACNPAAGMRLCKHNVGGRGDGRQHAGGQLIALYY